jgi:outer membrane immunogenic protein
MRLLGAILALGFLSTAHAEPYAGGGIGRAAVELGGFDESDTAKKLVVGYIFDLPAIDFSVEANYIDFGSPTDSGAELDVKGLDALAVVGVDFGLVGLFAKAGVISWDADAAGPGFSASDDGTDSAYGVGVRFNLASIDVRTEYEKFDIDVLDDLNLISASVLWRF